MFGNKMSISVGMAGDVFCAKFVDENTLVSTSDDNVHPTPSVEFGVLTPEP